MSSVGCGKADFSTLLSPNAACLLIIANFSLRFSISFAIFSIGGEP